MRPFGWISSGRTAIRCTAVCVLLALAVSILVAAMSVATPAPAIAQERETLRSAADAVRAVPESERFSVWDCYFVDLRDVARVPAVFIKGAAAGRLVSHVYRQGFKGFAVKLPPQAAEVLKRHPDVASVRPDRV